MKFAEKIIILVGKGNSALRFIKIVTSLGKTKVKRRRTSVTIRAIMILG